MGNSRSNESVTRMTFFVGMERARWRFLLERNEVDIRMILSMERGGIGRVVRDV